VIVRNILAGMRSRKSVQHVSATSVAHHTGRRRINGLVQSLTFRAAFDLKRISVSVAFGTRRRLIGRTKLWKERNAAVTSGTGVDTRGLRRLAGALLYCKSHAAATNIPKNTDFA